jgi:hypothetical protein
MIVKKLGTDTPPVVADAEAAGVYVWDLGWGARELRATDFLATSATSKHTPPFFVLKGTQD